MQQHANQPLLAIYVFGSRVSGQTHASSDLDVALLGFAPLKGADAFEIKAALSSVFRCDIDLVDLLRADSVSKAQIVSSGEVVFAQDPRELAFFETFSRSTHSSMRKGLEFCKIFCSEDLCMVDDVVLNNDRRNPLPFQGAAKAIG